jgi:UDP-glucose 4-epimerase
MNNSRVIMVTGVASYWGDQLSRRLLDNTIHRVIGVDQHVPQMPPHERLDFVQADVRNSLLADLLQLEGVDTVYHLGGQPASTQFVAGLGKLLHACAEAKVSHLVWVSSTAVYGPLPTNAAFIDEDQSPYTKQTEGPLFELVTAEQLCFNFARQHPDLTISVLRPAHIIGSQVPSPLNRYLAGSSAPVLLGFDPMIQIIDEQDVLLALVHALEAVPVAAGQERIPPNLHHYNLAAEGLMPLTRLLSLTHTLPLPVAHPLVYWAMPLLGSTPWSVSEIVPYDWDFLRYRCVGASERQAAWGFRPLHSSLEAVTALAEFKQSGAVTAPLSDLAKDELRLQQTLAQRQQAKEKGAMNG